MSIQYTSEQLQRKFQGAPRSAGFARIAEVLRTEGRLEEAEALCRQGLEQTPSNITGRLILGKCLVDLERLDEAREQFESVLRLDSRCLAALHSLARILIRLKWPDAAAAYYRSILEIEPWDVEAQTRLRESGATPSAGPGAAPDGAFTGAGFGTQPARTTQSV
ncbi:MAG TPA: tetratricopeptide repeat protein, partial [Fibrobacteria bacterium]|nr:tetratricopeptide repeat protein [Fibrobacteria bacterium]